MKTEVQDGSLKLQLSDESIKSASLYYLAEDEIGYGGEDNVSWRQVSVYERVNNRVIFDIPHDATFSYASVLDNYGNVASTMLMSK